MATMAENVIAAGSETLPPMLEKGMYDSWKTRIILYIREKENGEMLKDSIDNGPYQFKSEITVKDTNGVTDIRRPQRLEDLKGQDKLCYDSDIKAINILLLGLPFVNHLQPEWSRFVTEAKQARDLHNVTFDQMHAFLKHNEKDAKEVRDMRQRFSEPLALLAKTYNPPPSYNSHQTHYAPTLVQQPPTYQLDTGLAIPTFLPCDDPIESLNKAMIFLSSMYRSKFPPTNNQLRTLSNPRTQANIQNGQVTVQNVQVMMEYLVNISKRRAFWSLNEDILKVNDSDNQYAVSIKEYAAYTCLHSPKTIKETSLIRRI
ncbi:hypothetical protein Tco_0551705 [Tanacetum coccineum]